MILVVVLRVVVLCVVVLCVVVLCVVVLCVVVLCVSLCCVLFIYSTHGGRGKDTYRTTYLAVFGNPVIIRQHSSPKST